MALDNHTVVIKEVDRFALALTVSYKFEIRSAKHSGRFPANTSLYAFYSYHYRTEILNKMYEQEQTPEYSDYIDSSDAPTDVSSELEVSGEESSVESSEASSMSEEESLGFKPYSPAIRRIIKKELKKKLRALEKQRKKKVKKIRHGREKRKMKKLTQGFRVPKDHPIFKKPDEVEQFIMDMELFHQEYTDERMRDVRNPNFITKLIMYFDEDWGARSWLKLWAKETQARNLDLSWSSLKEALRNRYSGYDEPRLKFDAYIELHQQHEVKRYIAKKAEAAMHCKGLSDEVKLFAFIRGLRKEVQGHVNLQRPQTLDEAQDAAITFENSRRAQV